MRKIVGFTVLAFATVVATAGGIAQTRANKVVGNQIVIVFKDGHRQNFNLADVARVEFPGGAPSADAGLSNSFAPPRGHFLGKWEVGDGAGSKFFITLKEDGEAWRSIGNERGKWTYVNGEARVTWNDGAQDAIRKVNGRDQKFAYHEGKSFTDEPDNVTEARNTTPRPI